MPAQTRVIHFYVCLGAAGGKECEVIMKEKDIKNLPSTCINLFLIINTFYLFLHDLSKTQKLFSYLSELFLQLRFLQSFDF